MQSVDSTETYAHGTSNFLICKKQETKGKNVIGQCKNY